VRRIGDLRAKEHVPCLSGGSCCSPPDHRTGQSGRRRGRHHPRYLVADAICGSYLVVLNNTTTGSNSVSATAARLAGQHHGTVGFVYQAALRGFATRMSESDARRLAADPAVAYVQQNQVLSIAGRQTNPPSWNWTASTSATCR